MMADQKMPLQLYARLIPTGIDSEFASSKDESDMVIIGDRNTNFQILFCAHSSLRLRSIFEGSLSSERKLLSQTIYVFLSHGQYSHNNAIPPLPFVPHNPAEAYVHLIQSVRT